MPKSYMQVPAPAIPIAIVLARFPAMMPTALPPLTSLGYSLDTSPTAFGELRDSREVADDPAALRGRMREDGYLFLRGLLDREAVLEARSEVTRRLAELGQLEPGRPHRDAVARAGAAGAGFEALTAANEPLHRLLYGRTLIGWYEGLLGGAIRHYDFTWFRAVPAGGRGTTPHCDVVYMSRGTHNLYTAWVPIGDVPLQVGGLMILENSHCQQERLSAYLSRDVDDYCTNRPDAADIEAGQKLWQDWDGRLSSNPVTLREKLGGRWLTTGFEAGDVLTFGISTVHASLDNRSDRFRLSSDSRYQLALEPADARWIGERPVGHGPAAKRGMIC